MVRFIFNSETQSDLNLSNIFIVLGDFELPNSIPKSHFTREINCIICIPLARVTNPTVLLLLVL